MDGQSVTVAIPPDVLDSLCSRFLINIPAEERNNMIRVFFQIELAHWFYLDFYRAEKHFLPGCSIKEFSKAIFRHCPFLKEYSANVDEHFAEWKEYKMSVPTYGAIMLDSTLQNIVMVQAFFSKTSWGFPKGKVNQGESPKQCAIREVLEETGFDITTLINEEEYIEATFNDQLARLYVVPNVPVNTEFKPKTRGEIKDVKWFHIDDLPTNKKDNAPKINLGLNPNNFFMAMPYMKTLKKKIAKWKGQKDPPLMESPLAALTKLAQPLQPHLQQQQQRAKAATPPNSSQGKQQTDGSGGHQLSEQKHRMRQQRAFVSQNQTQNELFLRFKDTRQEARNGTSGRGQPYHHRASPTMGQGQLKGKTQLNGTVSPQKQYQILTRNRVKEGANDIVADAVINASGDRLNHPGRLAATAFVNFKLDTAALMRAFDAGLYGRGREFR
ncbi:m7GpppN-mRNA hydrolase-like [Acanthaster planci]|uniref:m7GpppN-mRNA hydrolase n=1 Tax=Acanthaster planci TaxID=133434 RepID=A0A8B7ZRD9_ACAPL|nr:m7GpppN-mRNA hydrolase-like [Acanthaster planci]XP_022108149.1 m7GpppN-mRNA hydrolase-like [Acanthaster planci]